MAESPLTASLSAGCSAKMVDASVQVEDDFDDVDFDGDEDLYDPNAKDDIK
jgi:hypothetical protein